MVVKQDLALEILLSGESALLTGPAGTGKTFVLNQFINLSKAGGKYVSVTACQMVLLNMLAKAAAKLSKKPMS